MTTIAIPTEAPELLAAEWFGPTLQGEGPSAGQVALFIRLSRCNLTCGSGSALWACDTPYTWDTRRFDLTAQTSRVTADELATWVLSHDTRLVVITGGEPLLQQRKLVGLARVLVGAGRRIEIETNGTIAPLPGLLREGVRFNVSPKLASSGIAEDRRIVPAALRALAASGAAVFKFVVADADMPGELAEVAALVEAYGLEPVWIMPAGTAPALLLQRMCDLADPVIARGWNLSTRLHVLLWEDARGR
jgi:organic radical activating enzyme